MRSKSNCLSFMAEVSPTRIFHAGRGRGVSSWAELRWSLLQKLQHVHAELAGRDLHDGDELTAIVPDEFLFCGWSSGGAGVGGIDCGGDLAAVVEDGSLFTREGGSAEQRHEGRGQDENKVGFHAVRLGFG